MARGTNKNPKNRFDNREYIPDPEFQIELSSKTEFIIDHARTIITHNDSPDIPFTATFNPYRGCEHGCIYCYARPTHEFLDFSLGLDFETKILVKKDAPNLLYKELSAKKWKPQPVLISGATDAYQPIERKLELTRRSLRVFAEFRNPIAVITKNDLITRDIDILQEFVSHQAIHVLISVSTLDYELARILEPRTSSPDRRLEAIDQLTQANIPVGIMVAPIIPALNDHELPRIITEGVRRGASFSAFVPIRLPYGVKNLFEAWLERHFPDRKNKILNQIRSMRGGELNDSTFGVRMRGQGIFAEQIRSLYHATCRKMGIENNRPHLSTTAFRRADEHQLPLL